MTVESLPPILTLRPMTDGSEPIPSSINYGEHHERAAVGTLSSSGVIVRPNAAYTPRASNNFRSRFRLGILFVFASELTGKRGSGNWRPRDRGRCSCRAAREIRDRRRKTSPAGRWIPSETISRMAHAGQRLQDHRLHDAENGGVGADAQRQRENRHDGESRLFSQHAHRKLHVTCISVPIPSSNFAPALWSDLSVPPRVNRIDPNGARSLAPN